MGESANVAAVRRHYEAHNRQDYEACLEMMDPDILWVITGAGPDAGSYRGHDGVRQATRGMLSTWREWRFEPELKEIGSQVVADCRWTGVSRSQRVPIDGRYGAVWTMRGAKAVAMHMFDTFEEADEWARRQPELVPPVVMGVVNVTPDSFSDAGRFLEPRRAVEHGERLAAEGAQIVDVGGESTRPGAEPVGEDEELRRVVAVVEGLVRPDGPRVSIDTTKAEVARTALGLGARIVNDVSAFRFDPEMAGLVAASGADCCLMHMLGEPRTMQSDPTYDDVVSEVKAFLEERLAFATGEGVPEERIWLDPGIGFGKTVEHNLELLRRLDELVAIGRPVVVGTSRKSFLGRLTGRAEDERLPGTIATNVLALERGATVFRVHDVAEVGDALKVAGAVLRRG